MTGVELIVPLLCALGLPLLAVLGPFVIGPYFTGRSHGKHDRDYKGHIYGPHWAYRPGYVAGAKKRIRTDRKPKIDHEQRALEQIAAYAGKNNIGRNDY